MKMSLLEQMRMQRDQREAPLLEPYKAELRMAATMIRDLKGKLREIERFMGLEIAKHVIGQIGHEVSRKLMETIHKAVATATGKEPKPVRVTLPADVAMFMNPSSLESEVLRQYASRSLPDLSLSLDSVAPDQHVTTVDIRVPAFGSRHAIMN